MRSLPLRIVSLVAAFVTAQLAGCGASVQGSRVSSTESRAEINRALDDWHDAAAHADEARYFGHFAAHGVFLGTDATERWDVQAFRAYAHPHFERGRAWSFRSVRREVVIDSRGLVAWFDEDLTTENLGPARGSGVLQRDGHGRWAIAQYVLSATIPNERFSEVKALLASEARPTD